MRILTLAPNAIRRDLARAADKGSSFVHATHWLTVQRALREELWSVLALDPTLLTPSEIADLSATARAMHTGILVCAPCTPHNADMISLLANETFVDVAFIEEGVPCPPALLQAKLRSIQHDSACTLLFHSLRTHLARIPWATRQPVIRTFGVLPLPVSTRELLTWSARSRRTHERRVRSVGFRSLRVFLRGVRLAWAWDFLRAPGERSLTDVAIACGFPGTRELWTHAHAVLGLSPSALADTVPSSETVGRLRTTMMR